MVKPLTPEQARLYRAYKSGEPAQHAQFYLPGTDELDPDVWPTLVEAIVLQNENERELNGMVTRG